GRHTFQVTWKSPGSQSVTATDTSNTAMQASASVTVAVAPKVIIFGGLGQNAVAGTPQSFTVTITDDLGNMATGYVGTVHFGSSDSRAVLPADYTFTATDQGTHTFQVTFKTTRTQ